MDREMDGFLSEKRHTLMVGITCDKVRRAREKRER